MHPPQLGAQDAQPNVVLDVPAAGAVREVDVHIEMEKNAVPYVISQAVGSRA